jgi:antitoxin ParD1/3/4
MANIEKVNVAVTPEMGATLRAAVSLGGYATEGEVVREALREWMFMRQRRREAVEELRRLVQEGIESEGF